MNVADIDRLIAKIESTAKEHSAKFDALIARIAELHTDLEVLKQRGSSGEKDVLELKSRVGIVEHKQAAAAVWRAWMMGAGATLGVIGSKLLDWLMGKNGQ